MSLAENKGSYAEVVGAVLSTACDALNFLPLFQIHIGITTGLESLSIFELGRQAIMNTKAKELFFHYAEFLGYISLDEIVEIFRAGGSLEDWLGRQSVLSDLQVAYVKLLLFKYCLLQYGERASLLTKPQSNQLLQRKIWEIRHCHKPLVLYSLENRLLSVEFVQKVVSALIQHGFIHEKDLQNRIPLVLHRSPFLVPEQQSLKLNIKKVKIDGLPSQIDEKTLQGSISDLLLDDKKLSQRHTASCSCGNSMSFHAHTCCEFLQVYCNKCQRLIFSLDPQRNLQSPQQVKQVQQAEKKTFAHYALLRTLGEGAMGKVFMAQDTNTGDKVAIKILQRLNDDKLLRYFRREAQILQKLEHPNIIQFKAIGEHQQMPYLAMEYLAGDTLQNFIPQEGLPPHQVAKLLAFILDALHYAKQFQLVHRDIKPANIFIADNGVVKLLDMGIAKMLEDSDQLTRTGQILGTSFYISPEQLSDSKSVDYRVDIYAVGATIYHALCGIPPYGEYAKNVRKIFWAKLNEHYIKLGERKTGIPQEIAAIVEKAMAHDKEQRYQDIQQMRQELLAFAKKYR